MNQIKISQSLTTRDELVKRYLSDINKEPLLTAEEEVALAQRIHQGDEKALEALVKGNLRFVVSVAKQYMQKGMNLMDLVNEGNIGLITAARHFDETRGFKFISYAVWWIRQSIVQAIDEQSSLVHIPQNLRVAINKVRKAARKFEQEHHYTPSAQELVELVDLPLSKIEEALRYSSYHISADAPVSEDDERSFLDTFESEAPATDSTLMSESLHDDLNQVISTLNCREQAVIRMSYGIDGPQKTFEEIGYVLGLSRERIRQIHANSLEKLRLNANFKQLKAYA